MCFYAGAKGYFAVVLFQQIASIGNNISIQIVAGISMKVSTASPFAVRTIMHLPGGAAPRLALAAFCIGTDPVTIEESP